VITFAPILAVFLLAAPARVDPREDNPHYREARAAFDRGDWQGALAALDRAHALDPRPEYLFMQAQVLRNHDRCAEAIERYREFIATAPPREDVLTAETAIDLCEKELGLETHEPAPAPTPVVPPVQPPPRKPARRPAADPLAHALTWPGLALALAGAALLGDAHRRVDRSDDAGSEPAFDDLVRPAPKMAQAGIALLSIGGALVLSGVVRFAVLRARAGRKRQVARVRAFP
jgi:tetratricopeptide (TPR) repeat protein